ncbi:MAG: Crp/Fnr family transcriptional regulator [Cyanobacteria bacterium]|nr:Crp/Fnr family transcriptional regulator [Cyanobacteriota bacterium]MDA1020309.1 Crp/Fnr family transcriptional regulator [Cyanobacteriota bacterium]
MFNAECDQRTIKQCLAQRVVCICDVILKHPLFKNIKRQQSHELGKIADIIDIQNKQALFFNFQSLDRIYFVLRGRIKLHNYDDNSSKEYIYKILDQGQAAGLELLHTELQYFPYAATALTDSKILTLKANEFKEVIENDPIMKANLLEYISNLSLGLYDRSRDFVLTSVPERLLKYLQYKSLQYDSNEFELEISKSDLANYLGTISATLSRAFKELEATGQLELKKDRVVLKQAISTT